MRLSTRTRDWRVPSLDCGRGLGGSGVAMVFSLVPGSYTPFAIGILSQGTTLERRPLFESEFECNLFALRKDKLRQISALGQQTYPNQFVASHTLSEVRQQFGETPAEVLDTQ